MFLVYLLEKIEKFTPKGWRPNHLSLRLILLIVGFLVLAEALILIPTLPNFHRSEMQSRMRELAFMAELRLIEEKGAYVATPIPLGCGVEVLEPGGMKIWFGSDATVAAASGITPQPNHAQATADDQDH